jgi:anti-sigma factor (TIGR02949 family)
LLTCKDFLNELGEFMDGTLDQEIRENLQKHVSECPNCWVVLDTSQRTIKIYKGLEPQTIPPDIHSRLMTALNKKMAARGKS